MYTRYYCSSYPVYNDNGVKRTLQTDRATHVLARPPGTWIE